MKATQLALAAGIVLAASSAHAGFTAYDFNGIADGTDISGVDLGGAVLTAASGGIDVTGGEASGSGALGGAFGMFGVINVSMDLTADDGSDVFISGFAPNAFLINSVVSGGGAVFLFAPNTASISFGALNGSAVTFDNLVLESIDVSPGSGPGPSDVPVPAALPLMATALAGVAYLGSRRRK